MNKNVTIVYERVLNVVLDDFDVEVQKMLHSNELECVQARTVLYVSLHEKGFSDTEIAQCCGVCRESVNRTRNRFIEFVEIQKNKVPWLMQISLDKIRGQKS